MTQRLWLLVGMVLLLLSSRYTASAQQRDTLSLTLSQAQQRLLQQNLPLLMQQYSIDSARAEVITAKLYDNPEVSYENVLYNHSNRKWFDLSYDGENVFQLQQVFKLAGKRNKQINLAKSGVRMSEYQFFDLLRTLRYSLRDTFYKLYYAQRSLDMYAGQIASLQRIVKAYDEQHTQGNVSLKDIVRLRSMLYDLQHDQLGQQQDLLESQSDLALLIRVPSTTVIRPVAVVDERDPALVSRSSYQQLLDTAYVNRYDLQIAREQVKYNELNLQLQKAMAVPDVQLGFSYDKQGNFERNYNALTISMPLPFFNRNQGNIKVARATLAGSKLGAQAQQDELEQEVMTSYQQALQTEKLVTELDPAFMQQYATLMGEVERNFRSHNIGLLEFTDLYDAYREHVLKYNELQYQRHRSLEQLNFSTGSLIFHP